MTVKTNNSKDPDALDRQAAASADRIANKHGLRDRARSIWYSMCNELLEELQPAIEDQAQAEAATAAKARLKAVLELPEAGTRRETAERLALESDMTAEQIQAVLASMPKQAGPSALSQLMKSRSPGISSDDGAAEFEAEPDDAESLAQEILNA